MMSISQISAQVMVGSSPKDVGDVRELHEKYAINSVLSLQTDADLRVRGINIELLEKQYQSRKIDFARFAIDDIDAQDMADKIIHPIKYLGGAVQQGKKVYVHCNAGICRATSTVLGYLYLYEGLDLAEGLQFIRAKRPIANPYVSAVSEALEQFDESN